MRIQINLTTPPPGSELLGPDEFTSFDVAVKLPEHLWIEPDQLLALAGDLAADPTWREKLGGMVAYAAKNGWVDERGRIRAHVVRSGS